MTKTAKYVNPEHTVIEWKKSENESIFMYDSMSNIDRIDLQKWIDEEGGFIEDYPVPSLEDKKQDKFSELATIRWEKEVGGIVVNNIPIRTDRETTSILTAARVEADNNPNFEVHWKLSNGVFATLNSTTIIALSNAVRDHIQACFLNEETISRLILAATSEEELDSIDLTTGWPN